MIPHRSPSPFHIQLTCKFRVGKDLLREHLMALSQLLHEDLELLSGNRALWN